MDSRLIPDRFGEYLTLRDATGAPRVLGAGGFGTTVCVHRARMIGQKDLGDDFALKILHLKIQKPEHREQFIAEIEALRALEHPNVVKYEDCGEKDGLIYLVMQFCRGGDLSRQVANYGPLGDRLAAQIILQICGGLREAHRKSVLHLDLKPGNVLLLESVPPERDFAWFSAQVDQGWLTFKIADFGLAGKIEEGAEVVKAGFSPMTCSPEQARREELDARSDIYSLGMTLWHLLAGRSPLRRSDGGPLSETELLRLHVSSERHDAAFPPELSPGLREILSRMLRKAPAERYGSIAEVADALREFAQAAPAGAFAAAEPVLDLAPTSCLATQKGFGEGEIADHFPEWIDCGPRLLGKRYRALSASKQSLVCLTTWESRKAPAEEAPLAEYLDRLHAVTNSAYAPEGLVRILEVYRTRTAWCVAEEWHEGVTMSDLMACRGRTLAMEEIAQLLVPVAESVDFLRRHRVDRASLSLGELRIVGVGWSPEDPEKLREPVSRWGEWRLMTSALALPRELLAGSEEVGAGEGTITAAGIGEGDSGAGATNAFCRLLYRLAEGSDVAVAADWDARSYIDANRLAAESNVLLRRAIGGKHEVASVRGLLRRICEIQGVYRVPTQARTTSRSSTRTASTAHRTSARTEAMPPFSDSTQRPPPKVERTEPEKGEEDVTIPAPRRVEAAVELPQSAPSPVDLPSVAPPSQPPSGTVSKEASRSSQALKAAPGGSDAPPAARIRQPLPKQPAPAAPPPTSPPAPPPVQAVPQPRPVSPLPYLLVAAGLAILLCGAVVFWLQSHRAPGRVEVSGVELVGDVPPQAAVRLGGAVVPLVRGAGQVRANLAGLKPTLPAELVLEARGFDPVSTVLRSAADFSRPWTIDLVRSKGSLVFSGQEQSDYDHGSARMTAQLPEEEALVELERFPRGFELRNGPEIPLPTGIYQITLKGANERAIRPRILGPISIHAGVKTPLPLPPGLAGRYWGSAQAQGTHAAAPFEIELLLNSGLNSGALTEQAPARRTELIDGRLDAEGVFTGRLQYSAHGEGAGQFDQTITVRRQPDGVLNFTAVEATDENLPMEKRLGRQPYTPAEFQVTALLRRAP